MARGRREKPELLNSCAGPCGATGMSETLILEGRPPTFDVLGQHVSFPAMQKE